MRANPAAVGLLDDIVRPGSVRRWLGMGVIAATFVLLIGVVIAGSVVIEGGAGRTQRSVRLASAYEHAASSVAAEESLERKYRLQPGPVPRAAHRAAEAQLRQALVGIQREGTATDRRLATRVAREHAGYLRGADKLFAAVDRHDSTSTVNAIDSLQVDPLFEAMQIPIYAAAARHEAAVLAQAASARRTGRIVLILDVATLVVGLGLILGGVVALNRSQRRLRAQRDTSHHLAFHDGLTGLPNRALFRDRTNQALLAADRGGHQVAVMFVDLNRFKDVNDTLGHHYGDLLLVQVAERFTQTLRAEDSVARLGGDEFAVLLGVTSHREASAAAERLTQALQSPFSVGGIILDVEASIGIALAAPHADVETVLRHADVAMYEAKAQHSPSAFYELTRDDNTIARLALLGDLRRGINRGELVLHYQPKVDARTGKLHSVEALVRWQHPTRGLLPPDAFIPIAENTAVIHPLTREVLRQALLQAQSWAERGCAVPVAVNISARSLQDLGFPAEVQRQLDAIQLPSSVLTLELTESAIMIDPGRALVVLTALDALGICLSIDDFGTGYSSMSYLKQLPVRELKIDRSFVSGLTTDADDVVLVQSAVDLGHNLGLHVVAEGVEDAVSQDMLAAMGCDAVQGYFVSRPIAAAEFDLWLEKHSRTTVTRTAAQRTIGHPGHVRKPRPTASVGD
jgi:diguanylate cyclase (GGDEF)-like protein